MRADEEMAALDERVPAQRARLPDFFIVGHAKSGTTAMYEMLRTHPQIYMPALKEPHIFARQPGQDAGHSKRHPHTLEEYLSLFEAAGPEQRVGEASASYLRSPHAAERIAELRPDARIVAIFREPASFLRSLHLQLLQSGIEPEADFGAALALEQERRREAQGAGDSLWARALLYSEHVRYVEQLRPYREQFGRERVLELIYDDFRDDNERELRKILRFLEVDDAVEIESTEANPTVRVRSHRAQELVEAVSVGRGPVSRAAKLALKTVAPRRLRRGALQSVNRKILDSEPPPADEQLMRELRRHCKGEVLAISEYLERDLVSLWGYDEVQGSGEQAA